MLFYAVQLGTWVPKIFERTSLKMETEDFSETFLRFCQTIRRYNRRAVIVMTTFRVPCLLLRSFDDAESHKPL